jgi:hypothetical protein
MSVRIYILAIAAIYRQFHYILFRKKYTRRISTVDSRLFVKFRSAFINDCFSPPKIRMQFDLNECFFFFLDLVCEAIGTAATRGLLCQPRVIVKMIVEKQMECRLAGVNKC